MDVCRSDCVWLTTAIGYNWRRLGGRLLTYRFDVCMRLASTLQATLSILLVLDSGSGPQIQQQCPNTAASTAASVDCGPRCPML